METEKTLERLRAEKKAMDASGYSELIADVSMDRQQGDLQKSGKPQQAKKIFSAGDTTNETVLLEK